MDFSFWGFLSCTGNQLFEAVDPAKAATWEDFEWYLNKTLRPQGDLCALHEAVLQARKLSRRPQLQARLVLTILSLPADLWRTGKPESGH